MKIQNFSSEVNPAKPSPDAKTPENSFKDLLRSRIKPAAQSAEPARPVSNTKRLQTESLKALVRDSFADTDTQIFAEIESVCGDNTGESIDMKLLGELLELYKDSKR